MAGFEPVSPCVGGDHSTNFTTTTTLPIGESLLNIDETMERLLTYRQQLKHGRSNYRLYVFIHKPFYTLVLSLYFYPQVPLERLHSNLAPICFDDFRKRQKEEKSFFQLKILSLSLSIGIISRPNYGLISLAKCNFSFLRFSKIRFLLDQILVPSVIF